MCVSVTGEHPRDRAEKRLENKGGCWCPVPMERCRRRSPCRGISPSCDTLEGTARSRALRAGQGCHSLPAAGHPSPTPEQAPQTPLPSPHCH